MDKNTGKRKAQCVVKKKDNEQIDPTQSSAEKASLCSRREPLITMESRPYGLANQYAHGTKAYKNSISNSTAIYLQQQSNTYGLNEIFARHQYVFKDERLESYFRKFDWYHYD